MGTRQNLSLYRIKKLKVVLLLTSAYLAVQLIASLFTGSLALFADAGHMLTDVGGLALAHLRLIILVNHLLLKERMGSTGLRFYHHLRIVLY